MNIVIISAIINFGMSILHLCLLIGMPFGEYVLAGRNKIIPKNERYGNLILFIIWFIVGLFYLEKIGIINIFANYKNIVDISFVIFTVFLGIASIFNAFITKSNKERYVMTPLSLLVFLCSLIIIF